MKLCFKKSGLIQAYAAANTFYKLGLRVSCEHFNFVKRTAKTSSL